MKTSGIYKITSPSNRIYIGQSSNVKERFNAYKQLQKSKFLTKLYRSFLKYGIENHKFEIIEECLPELLNERERFWQDYYNVTSKKGLNCRLTTTENKSGELSEETKRKIGAGNKGKIVSEEAKLKISNSKKGKMSLEQKNLVIKNLEKARKNNDYSHTRTEKFKKFSRDNMLRIKKDSSTVILQYSKSGDFIKEWSKIDDAAKHYDILNSAISNNLKGKSKTCKGFIWKYKN